MAYRQLFELIKKGRHVTYAEGVTQLSHGLQAGALARDKFGLSEDEVASAFLHDIGHLVCPLDKYGHPDHHRIGANYLRLWGFPRTVWEPVFQHVNAKRFLMTGLEGYNLSEASKETFKKQGLLKPEQMKMFIDQPKSGLFMVTRIIDDASKKEDWVPGPNDCVEYYEDLIVKILAK